MALPPPEIPAGYVPANTIELDGRTVRVLLVCSAPKLLLLGDVMSATECDALIDAAAGRMEHSRVIDAANPGAYVDATRTSTGTYFAAGESQLVDDVRRRLAALAGLPPSHGEPLQVLRYGPGDRYLPHFDFFDHDTQPDGTPLPGGQRVATAIVYLSDVTAGGGTIFPRAGLEIRPHRGAAVYFTYPDPLAPEDEPSLHGGTDVTVGDKWIATQWFRRFPYA